MNNKDYIIRLETPADYAEVENLTREAFWNVNFPGCGEHFFVHVMRSHPDFVPQLAFVLEGQGRILANIMYLRAALVDENGNEEPILTFGPLSVLPEYQRQGLGKALMEHSLQKAAEMGCKAVVIFGDPDNYTARGFKSCQKFNVTLDGSLYPASLLVKELNSGLPEGRKWRYRPSEAEALCQDMEAFNAFEAAFPPKEKGWMPSQETFYILSHSGFMA